MYFVRSYLGRGSMERGSKGSKDASPKRKGPRDMLKVTTSVKSTVSDSSTWSGDEQSSGELTPVSAIDSPINSTTSLSLLPTYCPERTLLVFDWDDTLLPTSWLRSQRLLGGRLDQMLRMQPNEIRAHPLDLPAQIKSHLDHYQEICIKVIDHMRVMGDLVVVTNSTNEWIPVTGINFVPRLYEYLRSLGVRFFSARPLEFTGANMHLALTANTADWKVKTFRLLALQKGPAHYTQIVSLGDGFSERRAVLLLLADSQVVTAPEYEKELLCKAVRYSTQPSLSRLYEQQEVLLATASQWLLPSTNSDAAVSGDIQLLGIESVHKYQLYPLERSGEPPQVSMANGLASEAMIIPTTAGGFANGY